MGYNGAGAGSGCEAGRACRLAGQEAHWLLFADRMAQLLSPKRLTHSLMVADASVAMGQIFGGDLVKLALAGLLHDNAKEMALEKLVACAEEHALVKDPAEKLNPSLLHGPVGAWRACHEWGVCDPLILESIRWHTTGEAGMPMEACIVFMADLIGPDRDYNGVETLRRLCREDLQAAMLEALEQTLVYLERAQKPLHQGALRCLAWLKTERGITWKVKKWP